MFRRFISVAFPGAAFALPFAASAHEVYVLPAATITADMAQPAFNMLDIALQNAHQFMFWGFVGFVLVSTVFFASIFRTFEDTLCPLFARGKKYAHDICRYTVAVGLLAGAYYQASYGPELPFSEAFGVLSPLVTAIIATVGIMMLLGVYTRVAAFVALVFFAIAVSLHGSYMLTYTNYLGEFIVLLVLGSGAASKKIHPAMQRLVRRFLPYSMPIVRIAFGMSLLYASLYAKILHNNLALSVAQMPLAGHLHGIAYYFGFEPHFMVLGAAIIEIVIALFFIFGIEIRWTCLFLEFWLSLSLWWFGESVWPHLILIGIPIAIFLHGYDRFSIEGFYFAKRGREPVL